MDGRIEIKALEARIEELQMLLNVSKEAAVEPTTQLTWGLLAREKVLVEALEKIAKGGELMGESKIALLFDCKSVTIAREALQSIPNKTPLTREELFRKYTEQELHDKFMHPDYEYKTVETGRKDGQDGCPGEGWKPNDCVMYGIGEDTHRRNWERYDYTEDNYWMRKKLEVEKNLHLADGDNCTLIDLKIGLANAEKAAKGE